jgi:hypothetical protein
MSRPTHFILSQIDTRWMFTHCFFSTDIRGAQQRGDGGEIEGVVLGAAPHEVSPHPLLNSKWNNATLRVWIAVLVQSISKTSCWVTTADDPNGFQLDTTECPFLPVNPRTVDDMTSLLYLHEAAILENLCERSKPQYLRPYTYVSNVLIAVNPLRKVEIPPMEVNESESSQLSKIRSSSAELQRSTNEWPGTSSLWNS